MHFYVITYWKRQLSTDIFYNLYTFGVVAIRWTEFVTLFFDEENASSKNDKRKFFC